MELRGRYDYIEQRKKNVRKKCAFIFVTVYLNKQSSITTTKWDLRNKREYIVEWRRDENEPV